MGCSNTLTDAQLQVMFSTTDEEMQRIKQPMDWPIERTKHKCKKCVRFFSNETALKQHHFELPFKKKKAPTFRKIFNSNNKRDVLQWLKYVIHSTRIIIKGHTRAKAEPVKWYLSLNMNFCKSTNPSIKTDPTVMFH